jgi:hypothetical protein
MGRYPLLSFFLPLVVQSEDEESVDVYKKWFFREFDG